MKADLAFAKERCAQLEEENKALRECRDEGDHHDDDDLVGFSLFLSLFSLVYINRCPCYPSYLLLISCITLNYPWHLGKIFLSFSNFLMHIQSSDTNSHSHLFECKLSFLCDHYLFHTFNYILSQTYVHSSSHTCILNLLRSLLHNHVLSLILMHTCHITLNVSLSSMPT